MFRTLLDVPSIGADAPPDFPMIERGRERGDFPDDPTELVVFVHGWMDGLAGPAREQASAVAGAFEANDYDAAVVGYKYPSNLPLWVPTKVISENKGGELAEWVIEYSDENPETPIRLVSHSLGSRVVLGCLDELASRDQQVRSCSLLGAGVDCDVVTEGGQWVEGVRNGARRVHNYCLDWEFTLEVLYRMAEQDRALGVRGACGPTPENYTDYDVSDTVDNHHTYLKKEGGCLDDVIADFE